MTMFLTKLVEERLENLQETENRQRATTQELRAMHSIRDRISTEIGDRVRVPTDREAEAMTTEIDTVKTIKGMIKIEGTVQTGAIEDQTDSRD